MLNNMGAPCPTRTDICIRNAMINTSISIEYSTNVEGNELLSDVAKLLAQFPLSAIDNMCTGPSVTSRNGLKACGCFRGSDILQSLTQ